METTTNTKCVNGECPICFNTITNTNNCTTPCGHVFCFQCITKAMISNTQCPCCRQELLETKENDEEDIGEESSEEEYDEDEDEYDDDDDDLSIDLKTVGSIETIAERFTKMGHTIIDALMLTVNRSSLTNSKYNDDYLTKLNDDFETMLMELDDETDENNRMQEEDIRDNSPSQAIVN